MIRTTQRFTCGWKHFVQDEVAALSRKMVLSVPQERWERVLGCRLLSMVHCFTSQEKLKTVDQTLYCRQHQQSLTTPAVVVTRGFSNLNYIQSRNAGHSKWANIKHTKSLKDIEKAREIDKYIRLIRVAARENGSPDPKVNKKLAEAIDRAKEGKIPTATIQRTLEHLARGFSKAGDYKVFTFPIKGPAGCIIIAQVESNTLNKARGEVTPLLKKHKAILGEESLLRQFEYKGIILCTGIGGNSFKEDQLEACVETAIEVGANDVAWVDTPDFGQVMEFTADPIALLEVCKNLESRNFDIVYSELDYLPTQLVELSEDQSEDMKKLVTKLSESQDILKLYANIG